MRRLIPILILLALAFAACQLAGDGKEENTFSFDALYDSLKVFDEVEIFIGDTSGADKRRIFQGLVDSPADLRKVPAGNYSGGVILITLVGHKDGKVVYEEQKVYDGKQKKTVGRTPIRTPGSEVTFDVDALRLSEGDSTELPVPKITPAGLKDPSLDWATTAGDVASIRNGRIVARGSGTADITASLRSDPDKKATFTVRVDKNPLLPASIEVSPETLTVAVGGRRLRMSTRISPSSASPLVEWRLEETSRASIDSTGEVAGKSRGIVPVKAVSRLFQSRFGEGFIQVIDSQKVASVRFAMDSIEVYVDGAMDSLRVLVEPLLANPAVFFESSEDGVVAFEDGRIRALKAGRTKVKVRSLAEPSLTDDLTVIAHPKQVVDSVTVTPSSWTLFWNGGTLDLKAMVHGTTVSRKVVWTSSDPQTVSVDTAGRIAPGRLGSATITATSLADGSKSDAAEVSVRKDIPKVFMGRDTTVEPGTTVAFKPDVTQSYGIIRAFKWDFDGDGTWDGQDTVDKSVSHQYADTGTFLAAFHFTDSEGNDTVATRRIKVSESPLNLAITFPGRDTLVNKSPITVRFNLNGAPQSEVQSLRNGLNVVRIERTNSQGTASDEIEITLDSIPPKVRITSPLPDQAFRIRPISVAWTADSEAQDSLRTEDLGASDGEKWIRRAHLDPAGNRGVDSVRVYLDTKPPEVRITSHSDGQRVADSSITIKWTVDGQEQSSTQALEAGDNRVVRKGQDVAGNTDSAVITIVRRTSGPDVRIVAPVNGFATNKDTVHVRWSVDGLDQPMVVEPLDGKPEGDVVLTRSKQDSLGLTGTATVTIRRDITPPGKPVLSASVRIINMDNPTTPADWTWTSPSDNAGGAGLPTPRVFGVQRPGLAEIIVNAAPYTIGSPPEASYVVQVRQQDRAGNWSALSDTVWVHVDRTPPRTPEVTAISPSSAPSWTWKCMGEGNGRFRMRLNGGAWSDETSALHFFPHAVTDADQTLEIQERDAVGNWSNAGASVVAMDRAYPTGSPSGVLACGSAGSETDTVSADPDDQGFRAIFDGTSLKGWWQSCASGHQGPAYWYVNSARKALMSTQDASKGSLLLTNKKYMHYELVFDIWPEFGNDAGIFNRTGANGNCFQTNLDYIQGASMAGAWGEGGFTGLDYRPFSFGSTEATINVPGNNGGPLSNWTTITSTQNPTSFGCSVGGCVPADWTSVWNIDGWNQVRVKVFGGSSAQDPQFKVQTWIRRFGAGPWVPVLSTTLNQVVPINSIGINIHGGGRHPGRNWYRNIRVRQLDANGNPLP